MRQRRIGPGSPGISRFLAARLMLALVAGFYLAGAALGVLYLLGRQPIAHRW